MIATTATESAGPIVHSPVSLTINGQVINGYSGQTLLEAATEAGIYIPTLCHHPAIAAYGGCRMCLVEIEKQRGLQPSCTFPVSDGLVVQTNSTRVVEARRFALELLFSERQHYCMFCPASGGEHTSECELQKLAYAHGMNCWEYAPNYSQRWPVDATRQHFVIDHARCVLCRRCVRACDQLVANHTLGLEHRGARTMICADDGVPFAESTCVSCGTCLQICPTGALIDRRSAFLGHDCDTQRTRTTCLACAVGCSIETVTREGRVIRVEGVWDAPNRGVLCVKGRFEVLDVVPPRLTHPVIRRDGQVTEVSWDEALTYAAKGLKAARTVAGLITSRSTNQCLAAFNHLFHDTLRSEQVALLSGRVPPLNIGAPGQIQDLVESDCVVVIGGNPLRDQKVLGYLLRGAVDRGARLIVAAAEETGLDGLADLCVRLQGAESAGGGGATESFHRIYHLRPDPLAQVKKQIDAAARPVLLYGADLGDEIYAAMRTFAARAKFLPLVEGPNAVGAARLGLKVRPVLGEALYVIASDELPNGTALPAARFTVVQASYRSAWTDRADVALPSKIWFEKTGHTTSLSGKRLPLTRSVEAPHDILNDWQTLFMLSIKMGQPLSCITVNEERTMDKKVTIASDWLAGCSGCHMSLLDMDERLIDLLEKIQITATPVTDLKHPPEAGVDVGILEGAVNNSATEQTARLMRARCKCLVALGDCAVFGGVPALRNAACAQAALRRAYIETESTVDGHIPAGEEIAIMQDARPLDQVVQVDVHLPGCPPSADAIVHVLTELVQGKIPKLSGLNLDWH